MTVSSHRPALLVARRFALPLEAGLVSLGLLTLVMRSAEGAMWMLGAWMVAALIYLIIAGFELYAAARNPDRNRLHYLKQQRRNVWSRHIHIDVLIITFASLMGVLGAINVLWNAGVSDSAGISRFVSALSIMAAWLLLQTGFSRLYAENWFMGTPSGGLDFSGTDVPGHIEFMYFTFSVGATFQTSDTSVTNTRMRLLVTIHAAICFVYNTVLLAFAVSLLTGH